MQGVREIKKRLLFIQLFYSARAFMAVLFQLGSALLALLGGLILSEYFHIVPLWWRNALTENLPTALLLIILVMLLYQINRTSSIATARLIERENPDFDGYLVSALELTENFNEPGFGYSAEMIRLLQGKVAGSLKNMNAPRLVNWRVLIEKAFLFLIFLLVYVSFIGIAPGYFSRLYDQYYHPSRILAPKLATRFQVIPGSLSILTGKDLALQVKVLGAPPRTVKLRYRYFGGQWRDKKLKSKDQIHYTYLFTGLLQSFEYYIQSELAVSDTYTVNVRHEPKLIQHTIRLDYPAYTGLKPRLIVKPEGSIEALYGTKVTIKATANKPLNSAQLIFEKEDPITVSSINRSRLEVSFTASQSDKFYLSVYDSDQFTNNKPLIFPLSVYRDEQPKITLVEPASDVDLDESMKLMVSVQASDDFGIDRLELLVYKTGEPEKVILITKYTAQVRKTEEEYLWDLSELLFFPGDQLSFQAAVWDNDDLNGSKRGLSNRIRLRLPTMAEIFNEVETEHKLEESGLQSVLDQQRYIREKATSIFNNLKQNDSLNWAQKKELEEIAKRQSEIKKQMRNILQQMSENIERMTNQRVIKSSTIEKIRQIRELVNDVLTASMKEAMQKLNEALNKVKLTKEQQELMAARFNSEAFEKKIERTLKLFKELKNKKELDNIIKENQSIMEEQRKLEQDTMKLSGEQNEEMRKQFAKELAKREEKLAERLEKMKKRAEELAEKMREENPDAARMLDEALKKMKDEDIANKMKEAAKKLKKQKISEALESEEKSVFGLFHFTKKLQQAGQAAEQKDTEKMLRGMDELITDTLHLSFEQEKFVEQVLSANSRLASELGKTELSLIARTESNLSESSRRALMKMDDLASKSPMFNYNLVVLLGNTIQQMNEAVIDLEAIKVSSALNRSKSALGSLNTITAILMRQYRSMDQNSGGSGSGLEESLDNLAGQQQGMNKMTEMLQQKLMNGEQLLPSEQNLLEQMAFEQSMISDEIRELMDEMQRLGEMMGQLSDSAKDSDEVAKLLKGKKLGRDIIERQKRILTRLLDAQRSRHRQDTEKRRQAETPKSYLPQASPAALKQPEKSKLSTEIMPTDIDKNIPEPYKELVKEYFRALSSDE